jgi:hypothetical protein
MWTQHAQEASHTRDDAAMTQAQRQGGDAANKQLERAKCYPLRNIIAGTAVRYSACAFQE